jgi:hypothetical protein
VAPADNESYRLIVGYLRARGPVEREPSLRSRGTADVLTMVGCGFGGSLTEFRRHLRRAREKGLIQGDLVNFLAAATVGPTAWESAPAPVQAGAQVIDLTEARTFETAGPGPAAVLAAMPSPDRAVTVISNFDRSEGALRLLAERGLSYGMLLDFSIDIDLERPSPAADPVPGVGTRRAVEALWVRGFEPADIAQVLSVSEALASAICQPLARIEQLREISSLYLAGMTANQISTVVGVGLTAVKQAVDRIGALPRSRPHHLRARLLLAAHQEPVDEAARAAARPRRRDS